jgi:hypothetical protein
MAVLADEPETEPVSAAAALQQPLWKAAMDVEFAALH